MLFGRKRTLLHAYWAKVDFLGKICPKLWTILDTSDQNCGPFWTLWNHGGGSAFTPLAVHSCGSQLQLTAAAHSSTNITVCLFKRFQIWFCLITGSYSYVSGGYPYPSSGGSSSLMSVPVPLPIYIRSRGCDDDVINGRAKKCRRSRTVFTELQVSGRARVVKCWAYVVKISSSYVFTLNKLPFIQKDTKDIGY